MQVRLALLADAANVSREGKLNILGVFDTVFAAQFPTVHPQMQLVLRFTASPGEAGSSHAVEVRLEAEDGRALFRVPVPVTVARHTLGDAIVIDHIVALANVRLESPGRYLFRLVIDGAEAATVPLRVEQVAVRH